MILEPSQYESVPVYDLMQEAARGRVGIDHAFLHAIVDRPERGILDFIRFGMEDRENDRVSVLTELVAICAHLKIPETAPLLVRLLRLGAAEYYDDLLVAFRGIGAASIELLTAEYEGANEEEKGDIAFLLAGLGVRDARILKTLTDYMTVDPLDAAIAFGLYGDPAGRPVLEAELAKANGDDGFAKELRVELMDALRRLDEPQEPEPLAFDLWDRYPERATPAFDVLDESELLEFLSSPLAEYRAEAAAELMTADDLAGETKARLFAVARTDPDPGVRGICWEALANNVDEEPIRAAMRERALRRDVPAEERRGLLVALAGELQDDPALREELMRVYENPDSRPAALRAMWRSGDRRFGEFITRHVEDPDVDIAREAIWGIGRLGLGAEVGRLKKFLQNEELRVDSIFCYALAVPAEISRGRVKALFRKIDQTLGPLSYGEQELVQTALDQRLVARGLEPVFFPDEPSDDDSQEH